MHLFNIYISVSISLITLHSVMAAKLRPDEEEEELLDPLEELGNRGKWFELGANIVLSLQQLQFLVNLEMTIPYSQVLQRPDLCVMDTCQDTMQIRRHDVRRIMCVQVMVKAVLSNTASYVPMEQCLTSNISSVTGGSMWTVLRYYWIAEKNPTITRYWHGASFRGLCQGGISGTHTQTNTVNNLNLKIYSSVPVKLWPSNSFRWSRMHF